MVRLGLRDRAERLRARVCDSHLMRQQTRATAADQADEQGADGEQGDAHGVLTKMIRAHLSNLG